MVESVEYKELGICSTKEKQKLTISFYLFNLNLYIISIFSINSLFVKLLSVLLINSIVFKYMFGFQRFNRTIFWNIFYIIIYILNYTKIDMSIILLITTTIINTLYYYIIIDNERKIKKIIYKN